MNLGHERNQTQSIGNGSALGRKATYLFRQLLLVSQPLEHIWSLNQMGYTALSWQRLLLDHH